MVFQIIKNIMDSLIIKTILICESTSVTESQAHKKHISNT
jgi:hypothetical protein